MVSQCWGRGPGLNAAARAAVGGGWALAFFTTCAMYRVPAAQGLTSQAFDLPLIFRGST